MGEHFTKSTLEGGTEVWQCNYCPFNVPLEKPTEMTRHHDPRQKAEVRCPKRDWPARAEKPVKKPSEKPPERPLEVGIYRMKSNPNEVLRDILSKHPDVQNPQMEEVMSWAELQGGLLPGEVSHLLSNMKNVHKQTANIIGQKYGLALNKMAQDGEADIQMFLTGAGQRPPIQPGGVGMGLAPQYQQPAPPQAYYPQWPQTQQWSPPQQQYQPPQQYQPQAQPRESVTTEDIRKMIKENSEEEKEESRLDTMEKNMQSLTNAVHGLSKFVQEGGGGAKDDIIHVTEPVRDEEGNILVDKSGQPITRTVTGPASKVVSMEDPAAKLLNQLTLFERIRGKDLTSDDIRKIVKEEAPAGTEDTKIKELTNKIDKMKEEMSAKERQKLEDEIKELRNDIRSVKSNQAVGEYKSDEMRFLGASVNRLADIAEGKKPLETAARVLLPPPDMEVGPEAKGALEKALEESGYVAEE